MAQDGPVGEKDVGTIRSVQDAVHEQQGRLGTSAQVTAGNTALQVLTLPPAPPPPDTHPLISLKITV